MAGSVNKVILIGNLGADPEIRRTQDGRPIANLRIATSESWRDKATGERKEKTEWHRVVIFSEGLCKIVEQYLKKGSKIYIEGQLQTRKYNDKDGVEKYSTEVVLQNFNSTLTMLDTRGGGGGGGARFRRQLRLAGRDAGAQARDGWRGRQARRHGRRDSVLGGTAAPTRGELEHVMSLAPLLQASPVIQVHAVAAMAAFALGIVQLAAPKGTIPHRFGDHGGGQRHRLLHP